MLLKTSRKKKTQLSAAKSLLAALLACAIYLISVTILNQLNLNLIEVKNSLLQYFLHYLKKIIALIIFEIQAELMSFFIHSVATSELSASRR